MSGGGRRSGQERLVHVLSEGRPQDPLTEISPSESAIVVGDTREVLARLPAEVFQTCITSPPYWPLRNYNIPGQIGLELTVGDYKENLSKVFEEVRRVLRADGALWLNIGDSYTSGGRTWRAPDRKNPIRAMSTRPPTPDGLKSKDLIDVPWRLAFALQEAGWYLRSDTIWHKKNCQPESVEIVRRAVMSISFSSARTSATTTTAMQFAVRTEGI